MSLRDPDRHSVVIAISHCGYVVLLGVHRLAGAPVPGIQCGCWTPRHARLEWFVAADCHAMSVALGGIIVPQGVMLDAAIVPESD